MKSLVRWGEEGHSQESIFSVYAGQWIFLGIFQFMLGDDDDVLLADVAHTLARHSLALFHLTAFCFMCQRIRTLPLIMVIVWSLNLSKIVFCVEKIWEIYIIFFNKIPGDNILLYLYNIFQHNTWWQYITIFT